MKTNKTEIFVFSFFFIIGTIFFTIGIFLSKNVLDYSNKKETEAIITNIYRRGEDSYTTYVSYNVDGMNYESTLNSYSSSFYVGKNITVYYEIDNPSRVSVKSLDYLVLIFPGIGFIFMLIGGIPLILKFRKKRRLRNIKESGQLIYADYVETIYNTHYTVNGRSPYNIICSYKDNVEGKIYTFKSENLWTDPGTILAEKGINQIPVYVDMNNKKYYFVDIDALLEK